MSIDLDRILTSMNSHGVEAILIGGMNFFLKYKTNLTYDVDLWINDTENNRDRCAQALVSLDAQWGPDDRSWGPVSALGAGWLERQQVFCLGTSAGAVDIFRSVPGAPSWVEARRRCDQASTPGGTPYLSLADQDMLACQLALSQAERKKDRIELLQRQLKLPSNLED